MDKKNTTIGIALLLAAFAALYFGQKYAPPPAPRPVAPMQAAPAATPGTPGAVATPGTAGQPGLFVAPISEPELQDVVSLANAYVDVTFTEYGGAIREVAFRKYPAQKGSPAPYLFNQLHAAPVLAFVGQPGLDVGTRWQMVEKTANRIVFRAVADGKLEVTRTFTLQQEGSKQDPYRLEVATVLRNLSTEAMGAQRVAWNLGTAVPVNASDSGMYLNAGWWNAEKMTYIGRNDLQASGGFLGMGAHEARPFIETPASVVWASVKNQFFASVFTPDQPGAGTVVRRIKIVDNLADTNPAAFGVTADILLDLPRLEPGASATLGGKIYVGPKEYQRLKEFGKSEENVMQFSYNWYTSMFFTWFFAPLLLTILTWFHGLIPNWGWAIILTTIALKTVTLPLTLAAAKSSKRMAKIQPRLKELNEKYADNPEKKQKATMELFKEAKVNPLGGCLPILITMPFFFGFYAMLQTSSDLRFAEFFWIKDLASPETFARLPFLLPNGIPINIMPLLMGVTQVIQMQLMPTPSVDNAQAKMFKFMPYMMIFFFYNFGSGLALYWTVSNAFTILQQLIINRMPEHAPVASAADGLKNVTPSGRKPKRK